MTIVNLRLARKAKARGEREVAAAANRARHGRTSAERTGQRIETSRAARLLEGHRLDVVQPADRDTSPGDGD